MGTLSGGGKEVISIGERCLLGANAGLGHLARRRLRRRGRALRHRGHAGDAARRRGRQGASSCRGANGLLFRRNRQTGAVEALPRTGTWGGLNAALHANDS